jgi:hypothetical protein
VINLARRAAIVGATLATVATVSMGSAGAADISGGFGQAPHVAPIHMLVIILFIPLAAAIVLSLIILLPGILRGEGLIPLPFKDSDDPESRSHGH